jgi:hypothetical protein
MREKKFNHALWDFCRFYNFFWLWVAVAYRPISYEIKMGDVREAAGLGAPYLAYSLLAIAVFSGSYFLANLKPNIDGKPEVSFSEIKPDVKFDYIFQKIRIFGSVICAICSISSGFIVYDIIFPDEPLEQLDFFINQELLLILCINGISVPTLLSLAYSADKRLF